MIDGNNEVDDFKSRSAGYLMAVSNLTFEKHIDDVDKHIEFIEQDALLSGHGEITVRLYTETNPYHGGIEHIKSRLEKTFLTINFVHVKNVDSKQMEEIISFANMLNSGITTQQTHEQNQRNYNEATPDFSGEDH